MTAIEDQPFRDRFLTPRVAKAITSPASIILAGAVAAAGILVGGPVVGAVAGVAAYAGRVGWAIPRRQAGDRIDPRRLSSPWREYVAETLDAQRRYEQVVATTRQGPLRARLDEIGRRIADGTREAWRIAQRGQALEQGLRQLDPGLVRRQLEQAHHEARQSPSAAVTSRIEALTAQLQTAERLERVTRDASDRLRLLDARLDEAVARAVELSLSGDSGQLSGLGSDVDALVGEMESLRLALEETSGGPTQMGAV